MVGGLDRGSMDINDFSKRFNEIKDEYLTIDFETHESLPQTIFLTLNGSIDTYNSFFFQKKIFLVIEHGYNNLIFSCGNLDYISSTGIGSFASFLHTVKSTDGEIILVDLQKKVYNVFQILGFSEFFTFKPTVDEAKEFLFECSGFNSHSN